MRQFCPPLGGAKAVARRGAGLQTVAVAVPDAGKHGPQAVIFSLRDRIELVVVASRTVDGQTKKSLRRGSDQVFELILPHDGPHRQTLLRLPDLVPGGGHQESRGDRRPRIVWLDHIAGQLPPYELVIGQILVECRDDPITIGPRIGPQFVALETLAFAKADDVEPVPPPALAVMRRVQEPINQARIGLG